MNGATSSALARAVRQARSALDSGDRSAGSTFGARSRGVTPGPTAVSGRPRLALGGTSPSRKRERLRRPSRPDDPTRDVAHDSHRYRRARVIPTYSSRRSSATSAGFLRLTDRQRALLERGQEDGIPFEAFRPVVRQELDACRLATGLDRRPAGDLLEERPDVSRGIRAHEILGKLEQGHDSAVPLARGLAVGDRVAPDAELALEGRRQALDERRVIHDPPDRLGDTDRATHLRPREESLATDVEWDARRRPWRLRWRAAGRWCGRGRRSRRGPSRHW